MGFKFSGLFGFFETGDFDVTIPTNGAVSQVVIKTSNHEYRIWPAEEDAPLEETETSAAVPTAYGHILSQYRTALKENWDGQQLTDAGLNIMVRNVASSAVGYGVWWI